jgi:signal transduction histidine kinase
MGHRLFAARPRSGAVLDAAVALFTFVGSLVMLNRHGLGSLQPGPRELDWLGGVLAACSTLPLVAWRRTPRGVFGLTAAAAIALAGLGYSIALPLGPTAALFLFAASRDDANPWTRRHTGEAIALFVAYLGASAIGGGDFPGSEVLHTGLAWAVAWFAGERMRLLQEHVADLNERALRADRDAERERRLALAEERARIARDLHDSAGHAINVIGVRAGAARMRHDEDPERSRAALEAIEEIARATVAEIDEIVGSLRERSSQDEEVAAPPGLASLATLVAQHTAGGLEVTVGTAGSPRPLGAAVDVAAYRILQEALTNAARHGTGSAEVELEFGDAALRMTILNAVPRSGPERSSSGHGLIGMRERATLLGGRLDTARQNGTFSLSAELPYGGRPS